MKLKLLLLFLLPFGLGGCDEIILNELDEVRANKVKVILADQGIEGRKIRIGSRWNIAVDSEQAGTALRIIDSSRLLTRELSRVQPESAVMFRSRDEKEQQMLRATAEELAQTIEGIPGVLEAHVHLYRPAEHPLDPGDRAGSASLLALLAPDCRLESPAMVQLISGATGIEPARIAVNLITPFGPPAAGKKPPAGESKIRPVELMPPSLRTPAVVLAAATCLVLALRRLFGRPLLSDPANRLNPGLSASAAKSKSGDSKIRIKPRPAKPNSGTKIRFGNGGDRMDSIESNLPPVN